MEKDFDIEIQDSHDENEAHVQLPMNFLAFGEIEPDDVKVYIKQDVYRALEKYALVDVEHERGTILLGDYCEDLGKIHVIISNYIEARYTDASASTLTFTHETWDYVYKEQGAKYPDKKIVGWQHTHPSYGIFLSNYDLFIQENFFNLPFQVAYVIDPIQKIRGFFQWKNGKIEKLKGYYIYDADGIKITTEGFAEDDFWGMGFQLYLENNTDRHLCVSIEDASLDGYMITMIDILDATSGMKDKEIATFGDTESTEYKNFQGTLHVYDGDTYDTIMDIPFTCSVQ